MQCDESPPDDSAESRNAVTLIRAEDAAAMCKISESFFYKLHKAGRTPSAIRFGRSLRWKRHEIQEWIHAGCPKNPLETRGMMMNEEYQLPQEGFVRLPVVLRILGIGRTAFYSGIARGDYPKPLRLGPRVSVWRVEDIRKLIADCHEQAPQ